MFEDLIRGWDGEHVVARFDEPSAPWMLVGVHSTVLGPAMGGTRMKAYRSADEGLHDVLRLSQAMTMKQAAAGLDFGGGKAVLAVPEVPAVGIGRDAATCCCGTGTSSDSLGGSYVTAADMNTGEADLDVIGERTVARARPLGGVRRFGQLGRRHGARVCSTASGPASRRAFGEDDLAGRQRARAGGRRRRVTAGRAAPRCGRLA